MAQSGVTKGMFVSCLHSAVNKRPLYNNINLKPKQAKCLEALFNRLSRY